MWNYSEFICLWEMENSQTTTMYWAEEQTEHFLKYICTVYIHTYTHIFIDKISNIQSIVPIWAAYPKFSEGTYNERLFRGWETLGLFEYIACSRFRLVEHYLKLIYWSIKSSPKLCRKFIIQLNYYSGLNGNYCVFFNKCWCDRICCFL